LTRIVGRLHLIAALQVNIGIVHVPQRRQQEMLGFMQRFDFCIRKPVEFPHRARRLLRVDPRLRSRPPQRERKHGKQQEQP